MSWFVAVMTGLFALLLVGLLRVGLVELAHIQLELQLPWDEDGTHHA
jgi:hypothetical protein